MKKKILLLTSVLFFEMAFGQLGNTCGFPDWNDLVDYQKDSYVQYNDRVYQSSGWIASGQKPDASGQESWSKWTDLGTCNEQLLINHPKLAYTKKVSLWDVTKDHYNTGDLVNFKNGVYKATTWVKGSDKPNESSSYHFEGVYILPIEITPKLNSKEVVLQSTLQNINLEASIKTNGFTAVAHKIRIKKISDQNYVTYDMNLANDVLKYTWLPSEYGDYNLQFYTKNSVGVESEIDIIVKIARSTPAQIVLNSPISGKLFRQLHFSPLKISFMVTTTDQRIKSIVLKDLSDNTTTNIAVDNTQTGYDVTWTPKKYGLHYLELVATDVSNTSQSISFHYNIVDPTKENISFSNLPYQIKAVHGIPKKFTFDQDIIGIKSRNYPLTTFSIAKNILTVHCENSGRTGLEITTSDNKKYYLGLRIDTSDGKIPRYPSNVSIGSVSEDTSDDLNFYNNGINNTDLLLNNRMEARYTYINGGPLIGWNTWQPDRVLKFTKNSLKMGLIPVFVYYNIPDGGESYTTDLDHMQDPEYMKAYFKNLDLFLNQVKEVAGDEFFAIVLEPDSLGYMQQNNEPPSLKTSVGANTIGKDAGTLKTLVERINYEVNKKRIDHHLNFEFGWQLNLWAKPNVAGLRGIIRETDNTNGVGGGDFETQLQKIRQTASDIFAYAKKMGIMSSNANFVSIDKYGLDAMGYSNQSNPADPSSYTWFWNNDHWLNYLEFAKQLHIDSGVDVVLWQITVGHINGATTKNEYTGKDFKLLTNVSKHYEDSASDFFFGETIDFSNDAARFNYFSENKHKDPKLTVNEELKQVTWGNHFKEVNESGVGLVLMGAGVGDSTDGIGNPEAGGTLTDDHYWIQKVQDYYLNHLVENTLGIPEFAIESHNDLKKYQVTLVDHNLFVKNLTSSTKRIKIFLYDMQGNEILMNKKVQLNANEKTSVSISRGTLGQIYICVLLNEFNKSFIYKII